jgi:DNA-binding transcriptional regulator YhcF (GntR family)
MKNDGWVKIHRRLLDNSICQKPQWAWVWIVLLLSANHEDNTFIFNGKKQTILRGQFLTGRKELASKTKVSQTTLERILNYLESEHQIGQQKTNKYRVITIINYNEYQQTDNKRTTNGQQTDTNKNEKNEKNNTYSHKNYLLETPKEDIQQMVKDLGVTEKEIIFKGKQLFDWCETNNKIKKNYRAFLRGCLRTDKQKNEPINLLKGGIRYEELNVNL